MRNNLHRFYTAYPDLYYDKDLPAETRTTAMKSAISSDSRLRDASFSEKSNIASSSEPIPNVRSVASG